MLRTTPVSPVLALTLLVGVASAEDALRVHVEPAKDTRAADEFAAYPRYFLNTSDTLIRQAQDGTPRTPNPNGANAGVTPGLSKNNYITRVFPVRQCEAIEIQSYLLRAVAYEGGIVEVMGDQGTKDAQGKPIQFLFVTAPDFMMGGIADAIDQVDIAGFKFADATATNVYTGKNRTAGELKSILVGGELGNVGAFYYAPVADPTTNTIYYSDNPTDMAANLSLLSAFDKPPLQAEFAITIYEVDNDQLDDIGLDWDAWKRSISGSLTYGAIGSPDHFFDDNIDSFDTLLSVDAATLADFLNFLTKGGKARVMTKSTLLCVNAEDNPGQLSDGNKGRASATPATLRSVRYLPTSVYVPVTTLAGNGSTAVSGRNLQDVLDPNSFEGVEVSVTPYIGAESITADVSVTVNSLIGVSRESKVPNIASRQSRGMLTMKSQTTHLLGSFDKQTTSKTRLGVPFLKDIPVVKYLFSRETSTERQSKLVILVSPTIVSPDMPSPAASAASELAASRQSP
jgi:hypothetical protein